MNGTATKPMPQRAWTILALCVILTVTAIVVYVTDAFPLGVRGEWTWDYHWTGRQSELISPLVAFAVFAACVWLVAAKLRHTKAKRVEEWVIVSTLVVLSGVLQLGLAHLGKVGIGDFPIVTLAPWANGYCYRASHVEDIGEFLSEYHERIRDLGPHVRTHPPGAIVFYWFAMRYFRTHEDQADRLLNALDDTVFDTGPASDALKQYADIRVPRWVMAAAWLSSMVILVATCLTVVPIYFLAKRFHSQAAALTAAALVCVLPGFLMFTPATDQLFCPLAACITLLCVYGTDRGRVWPWFVAGLLLSMGLFMSLSVLPIMVLVTAYAMLRSKESGARAARWWSCRPRPRTADHSPAPPDRSDRARGGGLLSAAAAGTTADGKPALHKSVALRQVTALALAVLVFFLGLCVFTGFHAPAMYAKLLTIAPQTLRDTYDTSLTTRTYWKWIWWNVGDVLIFAGLPLCLLYAVAWLRRLRFAERRPRIQPFGQAERFHLALLVMLLALNFSGVTLGEVGRLWLQFMPFIAILAAVECEELFSGRTWPTVLIMACQMAIAVALKLRMAWL